MDRYMWRLVRVAALAANMAIWVELGAWLFGWRQTTCLLVAIPMVALSDLLIEQLKG